MWLDIHHKVCQSEMTARCAVNPEKINYESPSLHSTFSRDVNFV